MAEDKTWPTELSTDELRQIYIDAKRQEKHLMLALSKSSDPGQAVRVAEILRYFPGAELVD